MGNTHLLQKTCMAPNDLCNTAFNDQSKYEEHLVLKQQKVRSTEQIKQKILKYIETNKLQLYPVRQRKVLETLVSVEQEHIADKVVQMDKRLKILENQKRQLQRLIKSKEVCKNSENPTDLKNESFKIDKNSQKQKQTTQRIKKLKDKRKKLFQEAECLLLEDLDMIFQQIPKFDQNYEYLNSILSLSGALMEKAIKDPHVTQNLPQKYSGEANEYLATGRNTNSNKVFHEQKTQHHQTSLSENIHNHLIAKKDKKNEQKIKEFLKIEDKKTLKKNSSINSMGSKILRLSGLLMVVPIECFSGIGALRDNHRTGLPSGASLLQILMNKIKAVNLRRGCNLGVAFLVNEKYTEKFNQQIRKIQGFQHHISFQNLQVNSNLSNQQSDQNYQSPIPYHVIHFKNIWPSFDTEQKILLSSVDDQIVFSTHDGDLIAFIENSLELKLLIEKYRYVHITNINNMLSQIGDAHVLGFLEGRQEIDIAVKVLKPKNQEAQSVDYFHLDEQGFFTIRQVLNEKEKEATQKLKQIFFCQNQSFLDIEEYYIKSRIFIAESGPLKRLLMSRISRKLDPESGSFITQFYLHRQISSILYSKFTVFITVEENYEFSHIKSSVQHFKPHVKKNGEIGYSRYCKYLLGIQESLQGKEQDEMAEIDAGILHKGSDEIMKVINSLKKVKQVGFPIILYSDLFNNSKLHQ